LPAGCSQFRLQPASCHWLSAVSLDPGKNNAISTRTLPLECGTANTDFGPGSVAVGVAWFLGHEPNGIADQVLKPEQLIQRIRGGAFPLARFLVEIAFVDLGAVVSGLAPFVLRFVLENRDRNVVQPERFNRAMVTMSLVVIGLGLVLPLILIAVLWGLAAGLSRCSHDRLLEKNGGKTKSWGKRRSSGCENGPFKRLPHETFSL